MERSVSRIAVYAIGGNALSSPNPEKEDKSAEVLAQRHVGCHRSCSKQVGALYSLTAMVHK